MMDTILSSVFLRSFLLPPGADVAAGLPRQTKWRHKAASTRPKLRSCEFIHQGQFFRP